MSLQKQKVNIFHKTILSIFIICSTDHISHMKALSQLMKVMESPNFLENILKVHSAEGVLEYIENLVASLGK